MDATALHATDGLLHAVVSTLHTSHYVGHGLPYSITNEQFEAYQCSLSSQTLLFDFHGNHNLCTSCGMCVCVLGVCVCAV